MLRNASRWLFKTGAKPATAAPLTAPRPPVITHTTEPPAPQKTETELKMEKLTSGFEALYRNHHSLNTTFKTFHISHTDRTKALETTIADMTTQIKNLNESLKPIAERLSAVEALLPKKPLVPQLEGQLKLINKLMNRIGTLEGKSEHPLSTSILLQKERWEDIGFASEQALVRFAYDLPRALRVLAPKPEVAMNSTVGRVVDIYPHLAKDEQRIVASVFPFIFGRTVEEWEKASAEDKSRSVSDWAYLTAWRFVFGGSKI